jgi:phosphomannomutase
MADRDPIKVYDARWEVDEFDRKEVARLVEATLLYGRLLGVSGVTICRDARVGCAPLMELAADVALGSGFDVVLCPDPVSTPQSYFVTLHESAANPRTMGLTFTASHNPAGYVGLKVVVPPVQAIGLDCGPLGGFRKIREIYHGGDTLARGGRAKLRVQSLARAYVDFSMDTAGIAEGDLAGLTVVFDFFNGSAGPEVMDALQRTGASIVPLRLIPDGSFPTGSPNPTSTGKMAAALARGKEAARGAVVVGTDGDGDRLVFGDGKGILSAGVAAIPILSRMAPGKKENGPSGGRDGERERVLCDPKVDPLSLSEWARLGVTPVLFRNGHSQIKERMRSIDAAAAVEESGHFYHRLVREGLTVFVENSLVTVLSYLRSVKEQPSLTEELRTLQERVFTTGEFNYQLEDDGARDAALAKVLQRFREDGAAVVSRTADGADLMGYHVSKGIDAPTGTLRTGWYQAYLRIATNEKAVIRSHVSAADPRVGQDWEERIRRMLSSLGGRVID